MTDDDAMFLRSDARRRPHRRRAAPSPAKRVGGAVARVVVAFFAAACPRIEPTPACVELLRMIDAGEDEHCTRSGIEPDYGPLHPDGFCWDDAETAAACDDACVASLQACEVDAGAP